MPKSVAIADLDGDGWSELIAGCQPISVLDNLLAPVVAVAPSRPTGLALASPAPNPSRGAISFAVSLPSMGKFTVQVFDVAGRCVAREGHAAVAAGPQRVAVAAAPRLSPGLHFLRVAQGTATATTRFVVAR